MTNYSNIRIIRIIRPNTAILIQIYNIEPLLALAIKTTKVNTVQNRKTYDLWRFQNKMMIASSEQSISGV